MFVKELVHIQAVVVPLGLHELLVRTLFLDGSAPDNYDAVWGTDSGEAVGNDEAGPPLKHFLDSFLINSSVSVSMDEVASSNTKMRDWPAPPGQMR